MCWFVFRYWISWQVCVWYVMGTQVRHAFHEVCHVRIHCLCQLRDRVSLHFPSRPNLILRPVTYPSHTRPLGEMFPLQTPASSLGQNIRRAFRFSLKPHFLLKAGTLQLWLCSFRSVFILHVICEIMEMLIAAKLWTLCNLKCGSIKRTSAFCANLSSDNY